MRGDEGPVFFVGCALRDPGFEEGDVGGGEGGVFFWWGHDLIGVRVADALDEMTGGRVAGDDGGGGDGVVADVEAEVGLTGVGVATVAGEALGGKERADGEVVGDGRWGFRPCGGGGEEEGDGDEREAWHGASEGVDCWF